jgi:hypothetical protein
MKVLFKPMIMKNKFLIALFMMISAGISAQQVISSAGTHATGTNVQLSWTVGETMISSFTGSSAIITQGFHQGKLTVTAIEPIVLSGVTLNVFPNPVNDKLNISFSDFMESKYSFSITDANSRLIFSGKATENPQPVDMNSVTPGVYFIKVEIPTEKRWQVFKIVKQ